MALESAFKTKTIRKIRKMFPGCIVMKNDANYLQGVPDILILWYDRWATLEFKKDASAKSQPNQPWYVEQMNDWSFSAFIYPENEREVLSALQRAFESER